MFEVGQRVKCVMAKHNKYLKESQDYWVRAIVRDRSGDLIEVCDSDKVVIKGGPFFASRFELVEETAIKPAATTTIDYSQITKEIVGRYK